MDAAMPYRIASAPCSFGVDDVLTDDAWMPEPDEMLDWMLGIGYTGTELGPRSYLGVGADAWARLFRRNLALVGSFLPLHFAHAETFASELGWLRDRTLEVKAASPDDSAPFIVLCDALDDPDRRRWSGRIAEHPEVVLDRAAADAFRDRLHRAGEVVRAAGLRAVIHPHAGTHLETDAEIERIVDGLDPSLVGLCLDTGHFAYGGGDPAARIRDYRAVLQHVHIKDFAPHVLARVRAADGGLVEALKAGCFPALGDGATDFGAVVRALRAAGYDGWLVVEQDRSLRKEDTRADLVAQQRRNLAVIRAAGA